MDLPGLEEANAAPLLHPTLEPMAQACLRKIVYLWPKPEALLNHVYRRTISDLSFRLRAEPAMKDLLFPFILSLGRDRIPQREMIGKSALIQNSVNFEAFSQIHDELGLITRLLGLVEAKL